jgi:hypothetical protein
MTGHHEQTESSHVPSNFSSRIASFSGVVGVTRNAAPPRGPGTNFLRTQQTAPTVASNEGKKPLRLGLIIAIGEDPDAPMAKVHDLGIPTTQVFVEEFESHTGNFGRCHRATAQSWRRAWPECAPLCTTPSFGALKRFCLYPRS